jgi:hypothetical protein
VNQDEVALVAKLREESRPDGSVGIRAFETFESFDCVGGDAVTISFRRCAPRFPFEAEELVEEGGTFKSKRDRGKFGQRNHLKLSLVNQSEKANPQGLKPAIILLDLCTG